MAIISKNRMVSFRLPPEEYEQFREISYATGGHSVSELLRTAVSRFLNDWSPAQPLGSTLEDRVAHLEGQVQTLRAEVRRLKQPNTADHVLAANQ